MERLWNWCPLNMWASGILFTTGIGISFPLAVKTYARLYNDEEPPVRNGLYYLSLSAGLVALGYLNLIASSYLVPEPINFHPDQTSLKLDKIISVACPSKLSLGNLYRGISEIFNDSVKKPERIEKELFLKQCTVSQRNGQFAAREAVLFLNREGVSSGVVHCRERNKQPNAYACNLKISETDFHNLKKKYKEDRLKNYLNAGCAELNIEMRMQPSSDLIESYEIKEISLANQPKCQEIQKELLDK